ncbi:uncharacterized protein [Heterodontus francisci]
MDYKNYAHFCLRCSYCESGSNLVKAASCTATANTQCRCKKGYYCASRQNNKCDRCKRITKCRAGERVVTEATIDSDRKCEKCPPGTFFRVNGTQSQCQPFTKRDQMQQITLSPRTQLADANCTSQPSAGTSQRPLDVITTPSASDWTVPMVTLSGIFLAAIFIIIAFVYMKRRRRVTIKRMEHHTTEMMDELLHLRVVKVMMEKSEEVVETVVGFRGHSPRQSEEVSKETSCLISETGSYPTLQAHKPALYTEVIQGSPPSLASKSSRCLANGGTGQEKRPAMLLNGNLLLGFSPSWTGNRTVQAGSGRPACRHSPGPQPATWGRGEAQSLRSVQAEDRDYCNLETDSVETGAPPIPPRARASELEECEARSLISTRQTRFDPCNSSAPGPARLPASRTSPPTMTASEMFGQVGHHRLAGPITVLVSPPTPDQQRRRDSETIGGGRGGQRGVGRSQESLEVDGAFRKAGSCPGQLGDPALASNLQPEEDEWTE